MTEHPIYRKPNTGKKIAYFVLLFIPVVVLFYFGVMSIAIIKAFSASTKMRLIEKCDNAYEMALITLFEGMNPPIELLTQKQLPVEQEEFTTLVQAHPGIIEIGTIKDGKYSIINSNIQSEKVRNSVSELALALIDTIGWRTTYLYAPTDLDANFSHTHINIDGGDYLLNFCKMGDQIRLVVTDLEKVKPSLQGIFEQAKQTNQILYEEYFGYYPGNNMAQVKLYDKAGENFFTFGKARGTAWKETREMEFQYAPWRMTVQLFSGHEWEITMADKLENIPWKWIILLAVPLILIFLLGHFSPRLHGFSLDKEHSEKTLND